MSCIDSAEKHWLFFSNQSVSQNIFSKHLKIEKILLIIFKSKYSHTFNSNYYLE